MKSSGLVYSLPVPLVQRHVGKRDDAVNVHECDDVALGAELRPLEHALDELHGTPCKGESGTGGI